ncbi:uncharacterized protein crybg2 [Notolabrus celidotus]|uniref:uncharacterized protein crybg2 n=1 Tax=Notolabrus celidotus TaxID=1203425 RepID=UPI0014907C9E|nr:uncharacterized protein crybg2 [Notolabrus celidotus]
MAKSPSKRSLKSLFSKSEANLRDSAEKDADKIEGEKKRFRFFRFRRKNSRSAAEKPANENRQVFLSPVDSTKEDGEARAEKNSSHNASSLYATAPRSKGKELSYSDLDLRKPRKFATFSFGLRRRKKKNEESLSKSAYGLHSSGIEELEEPLPDLHLELDQAVGRKMSMSQPELDTRDKFDIPSPPPVAANQSGSHFTLPDPLQSSAAANTHLVAKEPLTNGSDFLDVHAEPLKAPIATIPELQMYSTDLSEEKENIPVQGNTAKVDSSSPALLTQTLQASHPTDLPDIADLKTAVVDLVSASNGLSDNESLQHTKTDTSLTNSTTAAVLNHQLDACDTAGSINLNAEPSMASTDSGIDSSVREKTPLTESSSVRQEVPVSRTERSISDTVKSVTTTPAVSAGTSNPPGDQTEVYGALYDSLFPQSFTSEVISSILSSQSQTSTEIQHLDTKSESVPVKTFECHTERSFLYSNLSTSSMLDSDTHRKDDVDGYTHLSAASSERKVIPSKEDYKYASYQVSTTTTELRRDIEIDRRTTYGSEPADSYSGLTRSFSELKSDSSDLIHNTLRQVPEAENSAPPASEYVTSQGTDTQVTDPKRRAVLVKELVTDEASSDPTFFSPELEKMDPGKDLELKIERTKAYSVTSSGHMSADGALSPTYFSVGSDDGSAIEIYYSAEEDNAQDSGDEQVYTTDERGEICMGVKEVVGLLGEDPQQREITETDVCKRAVIVKMRNEVSNDERNEGRSQTEVYQQCTETWTSQRLEGNDAKTQVKEVEAITLPEVELELKEYVRQREEISQEYEIGERKLSQTDEGRHRVVIVKMRESTDDENEGISSETEVYQSSATKTSRFLEDNDAKIQEKEEATWTVLEVAKDLAEYVGLSEALSKKEDVTETHSSQTEEGGQRVVIVKMRSVESNDEKIKDIGSQTEVYQQIVETKTIESVIRDDVKIWENKEAPEASPEIAEEVKEVVRVIDELSKQEEILERSSSQTDERGQRVVIVKMRSVDVSDEKEDKIIQTEVYQQIVETQVITSLEDSDTKNQEKEMSTKVFQGVAEEVKEVVALQDIAERRSSQTEEGGKRAVIVKMRSVEGNNEDNMSRSEVYQQIIETKTITSLEDSNAKNKDEEIAEVAEEKVNELAEYVGLREEALKLEESLSSQTEEGGKRAVIVKMLSVEGNDEDNMSRSEVYQQIIETKTITTLEDSDAKITDKDVGEVAEEKVKELAEYVGLREEASKLEERRSSQTEEGRQRAVIVKMRSVESNDEMNEDIRTLTEVRQYLRGQGTETGTTEICEDNDAKIQEKETATEVSPEVKEGVKEVIGLLEEITEKEIRNRDEDEVKVVVVKNEGGKEDISTRTEELQQLRDESSLYLTSRTLHYVDAKSQENEVAPAAFTQVEEEVKELIEDLELSDALSKQEEIAGKVISKKDEGVSEEKKEETLSQTQVTQDLRPQSLVSESKDAKSQETEAAAAPFLDVQGEVKQVVELLEDLSKQEEIPEKDASKKKEEILSQTEVAQHSRPKSSESGITLLLQSNDAKSKETEEAATEFPGMPEVKQVVGLLEELSKQQEIAEKEISKRDGGKEEKKEQTSPQTDVQQQRQSAEAETTQVVESNDAKNQEKKGQEERKEELLATPVGQVKTLMVCNFAPPSSEFHGPGEGSEGNLTKKLEPEDHPYREQQLPSKEIQYLADKDISRSESIYAASRNTVEDTITPLFREAAEQVSLLTETNERVKVSTEASSSSSSTTASAVTDTSGVEEVVRGALTLGAELQSDATGTEHNRAPQVKAEWADTVTESTNRSGTVQEQVAVELSALNEDTHLPDTVAAETHGEGQKQPADTKPDLNEGSLTASRAPTAASENPLPEADQESDDKMNSGYSSLSTKLTIKNSSPPKEDESRYRFHKMSLIGESESTDGSQDTVDPVNSRSTVTEPNRSDLGSEYRWRNRFEGVSQYQPYTTEDSSFSESLSYSDNFSSPSSLSSLSSSSALPEATAYKHADSASSSPSPAAEEHITLNSRLSDRSKVYLSPESEPSDEWRRGLVEREEPAAPAGKWEGEGESERFKTSWEAHLSPVTSSFSPTQTSYDRTDSYREDDDSSRFTGVFKATLVELVSDPVPPAPSTPPASPEIDSPYQCEMDSLVDTLKNMGPSMRPRSIGQRAPPPVLVSSLPPIVEDAPSPISLDVRDSISTPLKTIEATGKPAESLNGLYSLPADLGLKRNSVRDTRSPLELMKQGQQEHLVNSPLRASSTNSIVMRKSSDSSPEDLKSPMLNGNGVVQSPGPTSRLDSSVIFGNYRAGSIDQNQENRQAHRPLFRTGSLPETGLSNDRMSMAAKDFTDMSTGADPAGSRFDRFSFLLNSSASSSGSLTGAEEPNMRMSRPSSLGIGSPPTINSPSRILSPTGSLDLQRSLTSPDSPLSMFGQNQNQNQGMGMGLTPLLQRSFSADGTSGVQHSPLFNNVHAGSQFQSQEQERNLLSKYRAFPDAYLTKEKEHGKLNPRPGKMFIFDQPGMCGQRIEVRSDIVDATPWELQETISIRVVRGGWVLYEKPNFKGEKIALDEGDIELSYPFGPPEEQLQNGQQQNGQQQNGQQQNGQQQGEKQNGEPNGEKQNGEPNGETSDVQTETKPQRRFIIGSLRRAVRDYSVPEISLFPEENAEGKKVIFRDTSDDARIFGFPIKANSIIIQAGLWLVYAHPFFQGVPRVLEVGGYSNPAAWGVESPYVGSLHPLKVGEPRVENMNEPKIVIYEKAYFTGKTRTITTNTRDFMTRVDRQQKAFMYNVGSLKVHGGIWVGYEKEGYRGHQYLLEEGEYQDWRVWGACDCELRSVRVIRADLVEPLMVMFEQPEEDQEGLPEGNSFEVTEAITDVEMFEYKTSTRSIHVLSGAWVAYSHVDFSGHQYILEKGFYNNCADWGSQDNRICSVQPILLAPSDSSRVRAQVILYSEPDFQGECHVFDRNQEALPEKLLTKSCRVSGGSWALYEDIKLSGNLYVLSEGDYPNLTSMGCPPSSTIRSFKAVPLTFSVPSISLFGLECLEGREITTEAEVISMVEEGFNNHILSVRVNSGCWVICEHSNYRGRQFLLEPIEITNWPKFSTLQTIGSMFPVRQKRHFFRIKNKERGHFLSIQGGVEELKSGRVVVTPEVEGLSDIWFYQDGFIKSKMSPLMSLQVMGNIEPAAKVVLWSVTRQPIQNWTAKMRGLISSLTFPGLVLDVKGGKTYDKDHVVIMPENEERPSQQWEIELL